MTTTSAKSPNKHVPSNVAQYVSLYSASKQKKGKSKKWDSEDVYFSKYNMKSAKFSEVLTSAIDENGYYVAFSDIITQEDNMDDQNRKNLRIGKFSINGPGGVLVEYNNGDISIFGFFSYAIDDSGTVDTSSPPDIFSCPCLYNMVDQCDTLLSVCRMAHLWPYNFPIGPHYPSIYASYGTFMISESGAKGSTELTFCDRCECVIHVNCAISRGLIHPFFHFMTEEEKGNASVTCDRCALRDRLVDGKSTTTEQRAREPITYSKKLDNSIAGLGRPRRSIGVIDGKEIFTSGGEYQLAGVLEELALLAKTYGFGDVTDEMIDADNTERTVDQLLILSVILNINENGKRRDIGSLDEGRVSLSAVDDAMWKKMLVRVGDIEDTKKIAKAKALLRGVLRTRRRSIPKSTRDFIKSEYFNDNQQEVQVAKMSKSIQEQAFYATLSSIRGAKFCLRFKGLDAVLPILILRYYRPSETREVTGGGGGSCVSFETKLAGKITPRSHDREILEQLRSVEVKRKCRTTIAEAKEEERTEPDVPKKKVKRGRKRSSGTEKVKEKKQRQAKVTISNPTKRKTGKANDAEQPTSGTSSEVTPAKQRQPRKRIRAPPSRRIREPPEGAVTMLVTRGGEDGKNTILTLVVEKNDDGDMVTVDEIPHVFLDEEKKGGEIDVPMHTDDSEGSEKSGYIGSVIVEKEKKEGGDNSHTAVEVLPDFLEDPSRPETVYGRFVHRKCKQGNLVMRPVDDYGEIFFHCCDKHDMVVHTNFFAWSEKAKERIAADRSSCGREMLSDMTNFVELEISIDSN